MLLKKCCRDTYRLIVDIMKEFRKVMAFITKTSRDKVVLVIGGGSGHEPLFNGFAGKGLADAVACGDVFAAPNPFLISPNCKSQ